MIKIKDKFRQLQKLNKKAFIAYVPFGFPHPSLSRDIFLTLRDSGVDIIEVGIPFSDPLADGPIIQQASNLALKNGANLPLFFDEFNKIKDTVDIPVAVMSYYNPIYRFGLKKFIKKIKEINIEALMLVDLPLEEAEEYKKSCAEAGIDTIFFITPTTSVERVKRIASLTEGFIYYISVTGITGPKNLQLQNLARKIREIKRITSTPVCVGFGIHTKKQVKSIGRFSDGVVVGSEIVKFIAENYKKKNFLKTLHKHIKTLIP
ncbi:MAG: tryptophan synthase subunit alpha [Candidatus Omnitrophica bacterium]|nr:tryptophan synthase subunit alpha [Candidatus Omnitrophota bacterium]MBD3269011.1 tryptophan synthase subunit alpha [Candidatus Omnitrophota bacterium]